MEGEKQETQKTVVAFIAGLLIGGLLVWVFGASSDSSDEMSDTENQQGVSETADTSSALEGAIDNSASGGTSDTIRQATPVVTETGSIAVPSQPAGTTVVLGEVTFPTTDGWIAVHEDADGDLGNALGASRYSTPTGLVPERIELLRSTNAGNVYHVVFYSENGDLVFDLDDDLLITRPGGATVEATFSAE